MHVFIAGTRGIPASHGGFETFAEDLSLHLIKKGHQVTVYCQAPAGTRRSVTEWKGVELVHLSGGEGALGTIIFDLKTALEASQNGTVLTLGYNTAIFSVIHRLRGCKQIINMDGIEWKRDKWSWWQRAWLRINEFAGASLSDHMISDHPSIRDHHLRHVAGSKISMIPYGARPPVQQDAQYLERWGLQANNYAVVIARAEPDNSILTIVEAFTRRPRGIKLVILGKYDAAVPYQRQVMEAANDEVVFLGAVYEKKLVETLRVFALFYIHGHKVGGTNPSLVEALGAGNAVIAHDNVFTRWVAGPQARYFDSVSGLDEIFTDLVAHPEQLEAMREGSLQRFHEAFQVDAVLDEYESVLRYWSEDTSSDMSVPYRPQRVW